MLPSSLPRSLMGVPDLGGSKHFTGSSCSPTVRPGHHDPFRRRTHTRPPADTLILLKLASCWLPIAKPKPTRTKPFKLTKSKYIEKRRKRNAPFCFRTEKFPRADLISSEKKQEKMTMPSKKEHFKTSRKHKAQKIK